MVEWIHASPAGSTLLENVWITVITVWESVMETPEDSLEAPSQSSPNGSTECMRMRVHFFVLDFHIRL